MRIWLPTRLHFSLPDFTLRRTVSSAHPNNSAASCTLSILVGVASMCCWKAVFNAASSLISGSITSFSSFCSAFILLSLPLPVFLSLPLSLFVVVFVFVLLTFNRYVSRSNRMATRRSTWRRSTATKKLRKKFARPKSKLVSQSLSLARLSSLWLSLFALFFSQLIVL